MKKTVIAALAAGTAGAAAASAPYFHRQNTALEVSQFTFRSPKVGPELDGFRIVQVSDLHNKEFGKGNCRLLALIEAQRPDLIVITGDIMDSYHTNLDKALAFARCAVKYAPCYFVTGNHEHRMARERLLPFLRGLEVAGVRVLRNEAVLIDGFAEGSHRGSVAGHQGPTTSHQGPVASHRGPVASHQGPTASLQGPAASHQEPVAGHQGTGDADSSASMQSESFRALGRTEKACPNRSFRLIGVDCQQGKTDTLTRLMALRDPEELNILLSHKPHYAAYYKKAGVDLAITGHAHGGQWRFPLIGGLFAPGQGVLPKYTGGMYRLGDTVMCVSRGLGNSSFPLRIQNRPELVTITLRSAL